MKKLIIFCLCGMLIAGASYGQGRGHHKGHYKQHRYHQHYGNRPAPVRYVQVRPAAPRYAPVRSPGPDYVYIQDDWRWNDYTNSWEWYGNRWVRAPRPAQVWTPGVWIQVGGGGWSWQVGGWR